MQKIKNILITGYKGFIGCHLTTYLTNKGYNIIGVDRIDGKEVIDITENDIKNVDCVIHLAAQTSVWNTNYQQIVKDNIISFIHIFNLCKNLDKKIIYASSSCSVNITSAYGFSKLFNDIYAENYGVGLRFHNVYGKNSRNNTLLGICLNSNEITLYNNGKNYRHFTYIDDVCKSVEKALSLPNGVYNVYNPEENSVIDFVNEVKKYKVIDVNITNQRRNLDKEKQIIDYTKENLVILPTTIQDGIKKVFEK